MEPQKTTTLMQGTRRTVRVTVDPNFDLRIALVVLGLVVVCRTLFPLGLFGLLVHGGMAVVVTAALLKKPPENPPFFREPPPSISTGHIGNR